MSDAFSLAMKPRRGPVCVNLPRNILAATNNYNINTNKPSFVNESILKGGYEKIKKAVKIINQAKNKKIYLPQKCLKTYDYHINGYNPERSKTNLDYFENDPRHFLSLEQIVPARDYQYLKQEDHFDEFFLFPHPFLKSLARMIFLYFHLLPNWSKIVN